MRIKPLQATAKSAPRLSAKAFGLSVIQAGRASLQYYQRRGEEWNVSS